MSSTGDTKPFINIESRTLYPNADLAKYIYLEMRQIHTAFNIKTSFTQPLEGNIYRTILLCLLNELLTHDRYGEIILSAVVLFCHELEESGYTLAQISEGISLSSLTALQIPDHSPGFLALFSNIINHEEELRAKAINLDDELTKVSSSPLRIQYIEAALQSLLIVAKQLLHYFRTQSQAYEKSIIASIVEI